MTDKWLTSNEIAKLLSIAHRSAKRRAQKESWPYRSYAVRGGRERRYPLARLPEEVQTAYAASIGAELGELRDHLAPAGHEKKINIERFAGRGAATAAVKEIGKTPDKYLRVAASRRKVLEAYSASGLSAGQFLAAYNSGEIAADVRERLGSFGGIRAASSLYRWLERYEQHGLAGLAPQYALRRGGAGASLSARAKELIHSIYLDARRPSVRAVVRTINANKLLAREIKETTVRRYIENVIPLSVKTFYRMGKKAYHDRFVPYIERDYTLLKSMKWGCGDHHLFDFVIQHGGRIFRPWLTMFQDMRSRKITGWHIDAAPNTLTIMRAFAMSVETCGLFDHLLIDNGKDFRSVWFAGTQGKSRSTRPEQGTLDLIEGVLHECGTKAHFTTPYRGQSKPIERTFRTIIELFSRNRETYVGSNTADRPDETKLYWGRINGRDTIEVKYTLHKLREDFAQFVAWYNAEWRHSGQGMGGAPPDAVFAANLGERREMPEEMRKYVFAIREKRAVRRNGICIDGINYYNEGLARLIGERVEVRRDINDVGKISIFSLPDCVYLFDAENEFFRDRGIPEENIRRLKNIQKKSRAHLQEYAKEASAGLRVVKSPAELMAAEARAKAEEEIIVPERKVVGAEDLRLAEPPKRKLKKLLGD